MRLFQLVFISLLIIGIFRTHSVSAAVDNSPPPKQLIFTHQKKDKTFILKENSKVKVRFKDPTRKPVSGKLSVVDDFSIQVGEAQIQLPEIKSLRTPIRSMQALGAVSAGVGGWLVFRGTKAINDNIPNLNTDQDPDMIDEEVIQPLINLIAGIITLVIGLGPLVWGITLLFSGRKFDLIEKWEVKVGNETTG